MIETDFRVRHVTADDGPGDTLSPSILIEDGIPQQTDSEYAASLLFSHDGIREATTINRARIEVLRAKLEDVTDAPFYENQALRANEAMLAQIQRELAVADIDKAGRRIDEHSSSNK
jgi:hypothetical protein